MRVFCARENGRISFCHAKAAWFAFTLTMAAPGFPQLVEDFYGPLYRFALSLSGREPDACDLTQQAFYIWATKGHQLRDASRVKTWLFTTLYREFLSTRRHDQHYVEIEEETAVVDMLQTKTAIANALDGAIVQDALQELDIRYRGPVSLFYLQQNSYREIAEILDIPIGTVMSRISRGKAELRKALSDPAGRGAENVVPMSEGNRNGQRRGS